MSLRVLPQVHGAAHDVVAHLRAQVDRELRAVTDSPILLDAAGDEPAGFYPTGNFHSQALSLALDAAAIAMAQVAALSEKRLHRLLDSRFSGLPDQLAAYVSEAGAGWCRCTSPSSACVPRTACWLPRPRSTRPIRRAGRRTSRRFTGLAIEVVRVARQRRVDPRQRARRRPPGARAGARPSFHRDSTLRSPRSPSTSSRSRAIGHSPRWWRQCGPWSGPGCTSRARRGWGEGLPQRARARDRGTMKTPQERLDEVRGGAPTGRTTSSTSSGSARSDVASSSAVPPPPAWRSPSLVRSPRHAARRGTHWRRRTSRNRPSRRPAARSVSAR